MDNEKLKEFADRYTAAWNSQSPERVAAFFAVDGSLHVNGSPANGRAAIAGVARDFMTGFPDMNLSMDTLEVQPGKVTYHWTFKGRNTGPGGTGKAVSFSGYEEWTLGSDGLIARSMGHFDEDEYRYQLEHGAG